MYVIVGVFLVVLKCTYCYYHRILFRIKFHRTIMQMGKNPENIANLELLTTTSSSSLEPSCFHDVN